MIDLYLVRHGETSYNLNKLIQGQKDIPLSIVGEKGAFELGAALKEKRDFFRLLFVFSSKKSCGNSTDYQISIESN